MTKSKFPNPCCQTLEEIVDNNPEISQMNPQELQIFRDTFISWLFLFRKQIQECEFCWPFFKDVIYPNLSQLPYCRTIILSRKGQNELLIAIIVGNLGIGHCAGCTKRQDFTPKKLFLSLDGYKLCLLCAFKRIDSLVDKVNEELIIKDKKGAVLDKKKLSEELMGELMLHWWNSEE